MRRSVPVGGLSDEGTSGFEALKRRLGQFGDSKSLQGIKSAGYESSCQVAILTMHHHSQLVHPAPTPALNSPA